MFCCVVSCHVMSFHVMLFRFMFCPFMFLCCVVSCHVMLFHVMLCQVISCWCHVVVSCSVMSSHLFRVMLLCLVLSCHGICFLTVGGLAEEVNEKIINAAFIPFGDIIDIQIPLDYETGKSYIRISHYDIGPLLCLLLFECSVYLYFRKTPRFCICGV